MKVREKFEKTHELLRNYEGTSFETLSGRTTLELTLPANETTLVQNRFTEIQVDYHWVSWTKNDAFTASDNE